MAAVVAMPRPQRAEVAPRVADRKFRPDVEGLRAVAVTLVVLYHAGVPFLTGGFVGVDVFFVLSGFSITGLLVRERATRDATSLVDFYARRVRRILPAGTLVLVFTVLAAYQWLGFLRADVVARDGQWTAFFASNLRFALEGSQYANLLADPSPLQHYWSLAVEEQFYLVWPLLFLIVAGLGRRVDLTIKLTVVLGLVILASFAWSVVLTQRDGVWGFFSPLTRAWELAIGALLAVMIPVLLRAPAWLGGWLSWLGVAGIVASGLVLTDTMAFPGYLAALPVLATACVVAGGTLRPGGGAEVILATPPFQWIGGLSYSWYLWHWPLLAIGSQAALERVPLTYNLGLAALALLLAFATFHTIEHPARRAAVLIKNPRYSLLLGLLLVLGAFAVCAVELLLH